MSQRSTPNHARIDPLPRLWRGDAKQALSVVQALEVQAMSPVRNREEFLSRQEEILYRRQIERLAATLRRAREIAEQEEKDTAESEEDDAEAPRRQH